MPVFLCVLSAKDCSCAVISQFKKFKQHSAHGLIGVVKEPFFNDEDGKSSVRLFDFGQAARQKLRDATPS